MNQKQADRVVAMIEYLEGISDAQVYMSTIGCTLQEADFNPEEVFSSPGKQAVVTVKECGSTACFCGHLPYAFPNDFRPVIASKEYHEDGTRLDNRYGVERFETYAPAMELRHGIPDFRDGDKWSTRVDEEQIQPHMAAFFGLPEQDMDSMVSKGDIPGGFDEGRTNEREALIEYLEAKLVEAGYEIDVV